MYWGATYILVAEGNRLRGRAAATPAARCGSRSLVPPHADAGPRGVCAPQASPGASPDGGRPGPVARDPADLSLRPTAQQQRLGLGAASHRASPRGAGLPVSARAVCTVHRTASQRRLRPGQGGAKGKRRPRRAAWAAGAGRRGGAGPWGRGGAPAAQPEWPAARQGSAWPRLPGARPSSVSVHRGHSHAAWALSGPAARAPGQSSPAPPPQPAPASARTQPGPSQGPGQPCTVRPASLQPSPVRQLP